MKQIPSHLHSHITGTVFPIVIIGAVCGVSASFFITLFKFCSEHIISLSSYFYMGLRANPFLLPLAFGLFFVFSLLLSAIYKKEPNLQGGGIPSSIGLLRGMFSFRWLINLIGTFFLSLISYFTGVPLGTEGPAVQMGCAVGRGVIRSFPKSYLAWDRYAMTGGACAAFSVATGAPLSGLLFAIEEAHQRVSPLIVLTSTVSVLFADLTSSFLSPLFGVDKFLLDFPLLSKLSERDLIWVLILSIGMGLFSVLYLFLYEKIEVLLKKARKTVSQRMLIFLILVLTLTAGLFIPEGISTGHHFIIDLFLRTPSIPFLILVLILRVSLTSGANIAGITGGIFLPLLAIGAGASSLICACLSGICPQEILPALFVLGMSASVAGMMQMPLTAILFSIEVLGCGNNLIPILLVILISYLCPKLFRMESIHEKILERREKLLDAGKHVSGEIKMEICPNSFAVEKKVRDIFWPRGVFILAVKKSEPEEEGLAPGDVLTLRYTTKNLSHLSRELFAITGSRLPDPHKEHRE